MKPSELGSFIGRTPWAVFIAVSVTHVITHRLPMASKKGAEVHFPIANSRTLDELEAKDLVVLRHTD